MASKLSKQSRDGKVCRLARAWLLRHRPRVLTDIIRQVEAEGAYVPRVKGAQYERMKRKPRKPGTRRPTTFTVLRIVEDRMQKSEKETQEHESTS